MSMVQDEASRWRALHELYKQVYGEIVRYRDMEWKVAAWTIALLAAASAGSRTLPEDPNRPCIKVVVQVFMGIFVVGAAFYGVWHIHFIHRELTFNRKLRQKLEEIFEFHETGIFSMEPILNPKWKGRTIGYSQGVGHLISWWLVIVLTAAYALLTVVVH